MWINMYVCMYVYEFFSRNDAICFWFSRIGMKLASQFHHSFRSQFMPLNMRRYWNTYASHIFFFLNFTQEKKFSDKADFWLDGFANKKKIIALERMSKLWWYSINILIRKKNGLVRFLCWRPRCPYRQRQSHRARILKYSWDQLDA